MKKIAHHLYEAGKAAEGEYLKKHAFCHTQKKRREVFK